MSKRVKRLPEDFLLKVSLGITCEFKFKSTEANFSAQYTGKLTLLEQLPNSGWTILGKETIDSINLFISSGRYFHWHVDTGVRHETKYLAGKRYPVSFTRSVSGIDPA